jgi:hypothetical protein
MTKYPNDADGAALTGLAAKGVDMTQLRLIGFAVAVPDEMTANVVAKALVRENYRVEIVFDEGEPDETGRIPQEGEFSPSWTVYAKVTIVPEYSRIIDMQTALDRICCPLGGKSDGWGTMID